MAVFFCPWFVRTQILFRLLLLCRQENPQCNQTTILISTFFFRFYAQKQLHPTKATNQLSSNEYSCIPLLAYTRYNPWLCMGECVLSMRIRAERIWRFQRVATFSTIQLFVLAPNVSSFLLLLLLILLLFDSNPAYNWQLNESSMTFRIDFYTNTQTQTYTARTRIHTHTHTNTWNKNILDWWNIFSLSLSHRCI